MTGTYTATPKKSFLSSLVSKVKSVFTAGGTGSTTAGTATAPQIAKAVLTSISVGAVGKIASAPAVVSKIVSVAPVVSTALKSAGSSILKSVSSSSLKSKVIGSSVAIAGAGFVSSNPASIKEVPKVPVAIYDFGGDLGKFSKNPTIEGAFKIAQEHPIITAGVVAGTGLVVGKGIGTGLLIGKALGDENIKIENPPNDVLINDTGKETELQSQSQSQSKPLLPETVRVTKTPLTTTRHRRKVQKQPLSQVMRVNIYNQTKHLNTHIIRRC